MKRCEKCSVIRGLTRISINLRKMHFSEGMDCRVILDQVEDRRPAMTEKPYSAACCATVGCVPATVARRMSRGCDWS